MFLLFLLVIALEKKGPKCIITVNCGELFNVGNFSKIVISRLQYAIVNVISTINSEIAIVE